MTNVRQHIRFLNGKKVNVRKHTRSHICSNYCSSNVINSNQNNEEKLPIKSNDSISASRTNKPSFAERNYLATIRTIEKSLIILKEKNHNNYNKYSTELKELKNNNKSYQEKNMLAMELEFDIRNDLQDIKNKERELSKNEYLLKKEKEKNKPKLTKTESLKLARESRDNKTLSKKLRFNKGEYTYKQFVDNFVVDQKISEKSSVKWNRRKYNRMTGREQEIYEKKLEKKIPSYRIYLKDGTFYEVPKAVYEYSRRRNKND